MLYIPFTPSNARTGCYILIALWRYTLTIWAVVLGYPMSLDYLPLGGKSELATQQALCTTYSPAYPASFQRSVISASSSFSICTVQYSTAQHSADLA